VASSAAAEAAEAALVHTVVLLGGLLGLPTLPGMAMAVALEAMAMHCKTGRTGRTVMLLLQQEHNGECPIAPPGATARTSQYRMWLVTSARGRNVQWQKWRGAYQGKEQKKKAHRGGTAGGGALVWSAPPTQPRGCLKAHVRL
jgi:hypothetical protein